MWEKTYGEHYEASLPSGVSESHKEEFVLKSAAKFAGLLEGLLQKNNLPETIYILEQGPGSGLYAKIFLGAMKDYCKKNSRPFYERIQYLLYDTSEEILVSAMANLTAHKAHVKVITDFAKYSKKALLVRHSNLWDQLPSRLFSSRSGKLNELQVQPILSQSLTKELEELNSNLSVENIARALRSRTIETLILKEPLIWKPLVRSLFLKSWHEPLSNTKFEAMPYNKVLAQLAAMHDGQEFVFNGGALKNIDSLIPTVDWQRGGYIEVVDIIIPSKEGFEIPRRPKKYDGSLASPVNGLMLKTYAEQNDKHLSLEKIRGLNHTATIRERSLKSLLESDHFVTIAEIAASKKNTTQDIAQSASKLLSQDIDVVAFSDQALVKSELLKLSELIDLRLFNQLPAGAIMPVLKSRTKTESEVEKVITDLKNQGVENLFVVTGDPSGEKQETNRTSLDNLPLATNHFFTGAVAHPQISDIPNMRKKIKAGAQFFIMQATYDEAGWSKWATEIKKQKLNQKVPIIAVVMPVTSTIMLNVIQDIKDVSVPTSFINTFQGLHGDEIRAQGLKLAKATIKTYKAANIFSGIYIYSKSTELIIELNSFIRGDE